MCEELSAACDEMVVPDYGNDVDWRILDAPGPVEDGRFVADHAALVAEESCGKYVADGRDRKEGQSGKTED